MKTRVIPTGLWAIVCAAAAAAFPAGCQSGGVGDPCVAEDEHDPSFSGFKMTEENIESRSFQCQTRICLVNHFQGRASCPLGQPPLVAPGIAGRHACSPGDASACEAGEECVAALLPTPPCDPDAPDRGAADCFGHGGSCDAESKTCRCSTDADCHGGFSCGADHLCTIHLCHAPGTCQRAGVAAAENRLPPQAPETVGRPKDCCIPGTDTPVAPPVCGQCDEESRRDAETAVYCSCRCGPADGADDDGTFNYCDCPEGFTCEQIRPDLGLGDEQLTGKYCIKEGSKYQESTSRCGAVEGFTSPTLCSGLAAN